MGPDGEVGGAGAPVGGEVRVGDGFPDHAPVGGLPGGDGFGEERRAHGAGMADLPGEPVRAARVGHEADAGEGLEEDGGLRCDHHVGGQREVGPCPGGRAVHRRDRGNGAVVDRHEHGLVFLAERAFEVELRERAVGEVLARAEGAAFAGEDEDAGGLACAADGVEDLGPHRAC